MAPEPIVERQRIAQQAEGAAMHTVRYSHPWPNPYPPGSEAAGLWQVYYERYLVQHSPDDLEASA